MSKGIEKMDSELNDIYYGYSDEQIAELRDIAKKLCYLEAYTDELANKASSFGLSGIGDIRTAVVKAMNNNTEFDLFTDEWNTIYSEMQDKGKSDAQMVKSFNDTVKQMKEHRRRV